MGTTTTAAALVDQDGEKVVEIAHVGDSRAYLLRDGDLEQLTDDHSLVEDLVRSGRLSPEDALSHPQRNIVTRALGMEDRDGDPAPLEVDTVTILPYRGDRILSTSDGLTNEVSDDQIASVLRRLADPDDAARELLRHGQRRRRQRQHLRRPRRRRRGRRQGRRRQQGLGQASRRPHRADRAVDITDDATTSRPARTFRRGSAQRRETPAAAAACHVAHGRASSSPSSRYSASPCNRHHLVRPGLVLRRSARRQRHDLPRPARRVPLGQADAGQPD